MATFVKGVVRLFRALFAASSLDQNLRAVEAVGPCEVVVGDVLLLLVRRELAKLRVVQLLIANVLIHVLNVEQVLKLNFLHRPRLTLTAFAQALDFVTRLDRRLLLDNRLLKLGRSLEIDEQDWLFDFGFSGLHLELCGSFEDWPVEIRELVDRPTVDHRLLREEEVAAC